jgi:hypothetical protein
LLRTPSAHRPDDGAERDQKDESIPDSVPSIEQATLWLAELGGYTGKSSGGPPGAVTIARGLFKLRAAADAIAAFLAKDDAENG